MPNYKTLDLPTLASKQPILQLLKDAGYTLIDHGPLSTAISVDDTYTGNSVYMESYGSDSIIPYQRIVNEFSSFPTYNSTFPTHSFSDCSRMIRYLSNNLSIQEIDQFSKGIFYSSISDLPRILELAFSEIFFNIFPNGKIICLRYDGTYYRRSAILRALYALKNYPEILTPPIDRNQGFDTLKEWLTIETHELISTIMRISEYFFFPFISAFQARYKIGLNFLFLPSTSIRYNFGTYPRDIIDYIRTDSDFGKETVDIQNLIPENRYSKFCFTQARTVPEFFEFNTWMLEKANLLSKYQFNITNFVEENNSDKIDTVYALENSFSILHILKLALSILSSESAYHNKIVTFQIADILSELCTPKSFGLNDKAEYFKMLFNKERIILIIENILDRTNLSFRAELIAIATEIYDRLNTSIGNSVWISSKKSGGSISVKNQNMTNENFENISTFSSNIIRSIRNTHHGYFTRNDRPNRPSRYLALINGNITDSLSTLSLIWVLCLLEDRHAFLGN